MATSSTLVPALIPDEHASHLINAIANFLRIPAELLFPLVALGSKPLKLRYAASYLGDDCFWAAVPQSSETSFATLNDC